MEQVNFIHMENGTREEYEFLDNLEKQYIEGLPDRLLQALRALENTITGYKVSRLEHSLQSATHALRAGEPTEMVVAALLHDLGDELAPHSHSEYAAAILRPYVSEKTYWIIKHHGVFQMYYYSHFLGGDRNARDMFKDHQWYQDAVDFCAHYDQNCFDPDFDTEPLETFEPMVREIFAHPRLDDVEHSVRFGTSAA